MAFLGSIGKFIGNIAKPLVRAIPATLTGFATGGKAGALLGATQALQAGPGGAQTFGQQSIFSGVQTSFGGGFGLPRTIGQQPMPQAFPVATGGLPAIPTREIFDAIVKLAGRLGIPIRSAAAVARVGRSILARLLRFARANPGLTIVNLLANLGLTAIEANNLITWFTTHGKRRRRIKVTNVKALNRSVRRLEGFRRLSQRVEAALVRRGVGRVRSSRRRCPKCRRSPCSC